MASAIADCDWCMKHSFTDSQLTDAVRGSTSIRQVLAKLGLVEAGGNYSVIKRRIQVLGLELSHLLDKVGSGES